MKNLKKIAKILIAFAILIPASLRAQSPPYNGAMEYSLPVLTAVPPSYPGESVDISADYLLLDLAMVKSSWDATDKFLAQMAWGDTAEYITGMLYKVMHDNPIVFEEWAALHSWSGFGFKNDPGHALYSFQANLSQKCPDTGRTAMLVDPALIADVIITDTIGAFDSTAMIAKNMVLVTCSLLDSIKGKYVPSCPDIYKAPKKGASPQILPPSPFPTFGVPAAPGTCLQFEYSLQWRRTPSPYGDVGMGSNPLYDSINGTWIKPGSEYIVFLQFMGVGGNPATVYFTIWPILQGSCAGMYPVRSGLVYDPNDDFGIGASSGLTPTVWKSRLRARIAILTGE